MSNFTDFISSGGGTLYTIPITASTTWTPPYDGTAVIHCIGAGGSGGSDASIGNVTGGGGGGYSRKSVTLSTGTNWTMVVGAGGASVNGETNGNAGGNTTATDGSSSLAANGGGPGLTNSTAAVAGGSASGGDVNNTGGASGGGGGGHTKMAGGGAVGVLGTGNAGEVGTNGNNTNNIQNGGHSDVQSPQFENTNGELRGGGKGGRFYNDFGYGSTNNGANGNGGFLAGGGGTFVHLDTRAAFGGDGGIGGGGGSVNTNASSNQGYLASGEGGNGLIIVMYTSVG